MLAGFAVSVSPLPGYTPHLNGSVETVNGASERMFAAGLPRYLILVLRVVHCC